MTAYRKDPDPFHSMRVILLAEITANFFAAEERFKAKVIDQMVVKNNDLLGWPTPPNMFQFRTIVYRHSHLNSTNRSPKFPHGIPVIHKDLEPEMLKIIDGWQRLEWDKQKLKQLLAIMIKHCVNVEQVRNAIPEFLVRHSQIVESYSHRTIPFESNPYLTKDHWDDYNRLLPRLHMYNGAALLS